MRIHKMNSKRSAYYVPFKSEGLLHFSHTICYTALGSFDRYWSVVVMSVRQANSHRAI
ncbi:hypothetical protein Mal48_32910 [Thalassoglobus polymorphus]|uniref:Uncharacterized protein n=1 Tax=Thalassoglobus polymorphus TaxID=2527994 RepID=A0A517QQX9_9PLAN|nr:hypothetical protein Mal48_32910 [Thalassoglobus polymorphus]